MERKRKEKLNAYARDYSKSPKGKEVRKKYKSSLKGLQNRRQYEKTSNPVFWEKRKRAWRKKYRTNLAFKILENHRSRIRSALSGKAKKSESSLNLLGCSIEDFRKHLEKQFKPGMSWENRGKGKGKWNVDHIRPCASFNMLDPEQQKQCFHFSNQQPLWDSENLKKSSLWLG